MKRIHRKRKLGTSTVAQRKDGFWVYSTYTWFKSKDGKKHKITKYLGNKTKVKRDALQKEWDVFFDEFDSSAHTTNPFQLPPQPLTLLTNEYLDEIEKAHPDLFNILLQVMDHGKLTDNNGKTVDFRNVVLVMTTNAGASDAAKNSIGFGRGKKTDEQEDALKRLFTPEFRNRLDATILFGGLTPEIIERVVEKFVLQLEVQLADRNVTIELTEKARNWLAERGFDEEFGARPLARTIQEHVKKPMAEELLFGKLAKGGVVKVGVKDGQIDLRIEGPEHPRLSGKKPPLLTAE